jgi:hypothetical protein
LPLFPRAALFPGRFSGALSFRCEMASTVASLLERDSHSRIDRKKDFFSPDTLLRAADAELVQFVLIYS